MYGVYYTDCTVIAQTNSTKGILYKECLSDFFGEVDASTCTLHRDLQVAAQGCGSNELHQRPTRKELKRIPSQVGATTKNFILSSGARILGPLNSENGVRIARQDGASQIGGQDFAWDVM